MSVAFNNRPRSTPSYPRFSGKVAKVTGEGEQVELAFTAETPEELRACLLAAGTAATARLKANNDAIVNAGATFAERQQQAYDAALATLREEMTTMREARREEHEPPAEEDEGPVGPPAPGDTPAEEEEETPPDADAAARALHAPADP